MGFTFLEAHQLLVDCDGRVLTPKGAGNLVPCLPVQTTQEWQQPIVVQRFQVDGYLPPSPWKQFACNAAWDVFAPDEIRLQPSEQVTIDVGIVCQFPRDHCCLLKENSGLAHRY